MSPIEALRNLITIGHQVSATSNAAVLGENAFNEGAGLEGFLMAITGSTPTAADDNTTAAVLELVRMLGESAATAALTCETLSQSAAVIAMNLRAVEQFLARLRSEPLKAVLEDTKPDA